MQRLSLQEQRQTLAVYRDAWMRIGTDCQPADRARAEHAIAALYRSVGLRPPTFVWVESPLQAVGQLPSPESPSPWLPLLYWLASRKSDQISEAEYAALLDALWAEVREAQQREGLLPPPIISALRAAAHTVTSVQLPSTVLSLLYRELVWPLQHSLHYAITRLLLSALLELQATGAASHNPDGRTWLYGQQDAPVLAACWYRMEALQVIPPRLAKERLVLWRDVAQSCMWWWPGTSVCVVCEHPEKVALEPVGVDRYHLHCENGPAVRFCDGWSLYLLHGTRVPERYVQAPETIAVDDILNERKREVRQYLIARFGGMERFLVEATTPIHEDAYGTLYRWRWSGDAEPLVMVRVKNATPEPNGSVRIFWLRVHPSITTAKAAVAWTFGLRADEYHPLLET